MALINAKGEKILGLNQYYNCKDYGVLPTNTDNTAALQALIDLVNKNGGGIIWIPIGIYLFDSSASSWALTSNITTLCVMKSGVSIIGESLDKSVLKVTGNTSQGAGLFCQNSDQSGEIMTGCTFQNFTVDMSAASMTSYSHRGKAFYFSGIKDCVFRDLRLLSTPSTSLGIDMLDNVIMDSIYVYQGGRQWSIGGPGGAGIGIGTGKWENENYIIRNCICDSCGHFGIFLEDQGIFASSPVRKYPKGQIIANNIVRNGRNYGIGLRGGQNVVITGNNIYDNYGGIYMDYGAKNVMVSNNIIQGNKEAGFMFGNEDLIVNGSGHACENTIVSGNGFCENMFGTWNVTAPLNSQTSNNLFVGNGVETPTASDIDSSLVIADVYIDNNGAQASQTNNWLYDSFVDLTTTRMLCDNLFGVRVAEYDENKNFLRRWYGNYWVNTIPHRVGSDCRYIKLGCNSSSTVDETLKLYS